MTQPLLGVWPPLPPGVVARRPADRLPFPFDGRPYSLFARARHAIWQGVQALGLEPGDAVLVPAYHHGSEVEALARAGLTPRFYDVDASLQPNEDELDRLVETRTRALYLVHYLGFPQDVRRWSAWARERGLLLVEDAAQAWLAESDGVPVGATGDMAVFCLYKTVGVADGAALVVRAPVPGPERRAPLAAGALLRTHARWSLGRSGRLAALEARLRAERPYDPRADWALGDPGAPPARSTPVLLPRLLCDTVGARRRANYRVLLESLERLVPAPFDRLPDGASPFAFPIEPEAGTDATLRRLRDRGIAALDLWSAPHPLSVGGAFPEAQRRRRTTIALPVHQELRTHDLERIVDAVAPPRRRRAPAVRLEPIPTLEDAREVWSSLARTTTGVFCTWEWASTWWKHYGGGRRLALTAASVEGRVVALLPLYVFAEQPLRVLRFIGHGPADQLGPLYEPGTQRIAAAALGAVLEREAADLLLAERLPRDEGWGARLGGRALASEASPVLRFDVERWEDLLASLSSNLRQQVRRLERRLARGHELAFRPGGAADLERDLDVLFELHRARWSGETRFGGVNAAFHREIAAVAHDRGWLRLWFLDLDGVPAAAWLGFRLGGCESYYQAGRAPRWADESVGFVLLVHTIRAALEDGMREYRFLRGSESFKYRFANGDPGLETIAVTRTPAARALVAATAVLPHSLTGSVRRRLAA